jgi:hypothetical protein
MSYDRDKIIALVYRIFQAEEFVWEDKGQSGVPSYNQIVKTFEELESCAQESGDCECGRIRVEYDKKSKLFVYYLHLGVDNALF